LLRRQRSVTVVGPPGVGKTRLAVEFAQASNANTFGAPMFCDLSGATTGDEVRALLARALGGLGAANDLGRALVAAPQCLFVLDDCAGCAPALTELLPQWQQWAGKHRWIVTTWSELGFAGETVLRIPPLELPEARAGFADSEAGRLFCERAQRVRPEFSPNPANVAVLGNIVALLAGFPLAIELAAGRLAVTTPEELLDMIRQAPRIVGSSSAALVTTESVRTQWDALDRLWQTIRAEDGELLEQLAVLPGRFDLAAALAVSSDDADSVLASSETTTRVLDRLQRLVAQGLVECTDSGERSSYRLLDLVRAHAVDSSDPERRRAAVRRWVHYFSRLAERSSPPARSIDLDAMQRSFDSLGRIARLEFTLGSEPAFNEAARAAMALDEYLFVAGDVAIRLSIAKRVREWMQTAGAALDPVYRARLMFMQGRLELRRGRLDAAQLALEEAAELGSVFDGWTLARAAVSLCTLARIQGNQGLRSKWLQQGVDVTRREQDLETASILAGELGAGALESWELATARAHFSRSVELRERCNSSYLAHGIAYLAQVERFSGSSAAARLLYERTLGDSEGLAKGATQRGFALLGLGVLEAEAERYESAGALLLQSIDEFAFGGGALWLREAVCEGAAASEVRGESLVARKLWQQLMAELESVPRWTLLDSLAASRLAAALALRGDALGAEAWLGRAKDRLERVDHPDIRVCLELHALRVELALGPARPGADSSEEPFENRAALALTRAGQCSTSPPGLWHGRVRLRVELEGRLQVATHAARPTLVVAADGSLTLPGGTTVSLKRRPVLRRLFDVLMAAHAEQPGEPVTATQLGERVWPGEDDHWEAVLARLYVAISELRKLGLEGWLIANGRGYALREDLVVLRAPEPAPLLIEGA
jgi:predicted ATPase